MLHLIRGVTVRVAACAVAAALAAPLPAQAGGVYFVKEGDSLEAIARLFTLEPTRLREANRLTRDVRPGDRLRIPDPDAHLPAAATVPQASSAPPAAGAPAARLAQLVCREEVVYHRVERGQTLSAVARRYGTTVAALQELNDLPPAALLRIGQRLVVRRSGPRTRVVRRGESLSAISARTGVAVEELRRLNGLADDRIAAGQRLSLEPCDAYDLADAPPAPPPAAAAAPPAAPGLVQQVVGFARTMLGIPYRFGGTTLRGLDCSAYVQRVFGLADTPLPRTAREQFAVGEPVPREELNVGDLVFFRTYASFPSHVGIYLGDDRFIHASSVVREVTIDSLDRPYFLKRFLGARRILGEAEPGLAASAR